MKPPLYALLISPNQTSRANIVSGIQTISVREGHRDYQAGRPVMLSCHLVPWAVMADIAEVRHCTLGDVIKEEYVAAGYATHVGLCAGLQEFYPDMTMDSPVTVIRWTNVRGKLVAEAKSGSPTPGCCAT